jgi:hypothetical protein
MPARTLHASTFNRTGLLVVAAHSGRGEGDMLDAERGWHDFLGP